MPSRPPGKSHRPIAYAFARTPLPKFQACDRERQGYRRAPWRSLCDLCVCFLESVDPDLWERRIELEKMGEAPVRRLSPSSISMMYAFPNKTLHRQSPRGSMSRARTTEFSRVTPLLVLAVTVLVLYFARELIIPFAFALTLAFLLAPAVSRLEVRRVPRIIAVAITGILAFTILGGVGYVVAR